MEIFFWDGFWVHRTSKGLELAGRDAASGTGPQGWSESNPQTAAWRGFGADPQPFLGFSHRAKRVQPCDPSRMLAEGIWTSSTLAWPDPSVHPKDGPSPAGFPSI